MLWARHLIARVSNNLARLSLQSLCGLRRVQAIVDKLRSISTTMTLVTTKHGHLHLNVAAEQVQLATEVRSLEVLPAAASHSAQQLTYGIVPCC